MTKTYPRSSQRFDRDQPSEKAGARAQVGASVLTNIMERFLESLIVPPGRVFQRSRGLHDRRPFHTPLVGAAVLGEPCGRTIGIQRIRGI
jgi:hypothetical protein